MLCVAATPVGRVGGDQKDLPVVRQLAGYGRGGCGLADAALPAHKEELERPVLAQRPDVRHADSQLAEARGSRGSMGTAFGWNLVEALPGVGHARQLLYYIVLSSY